MATEIVDGVERRVKGWLRMHHSRHLMTVCLLSLAACAPASNDDGESAAGPMPSNANRSSTCRTWQDASCDYLADRCKSVARDQCDEYTQSLFCQSDETMQACIDALAKGTCPDVPDACEGVSDPVPARWFCRTFIDALCDRGEACGLESKDECVQSATASLECDAAYGVGSSIETCLAQMNSLSCAALAAYQLPAACQDVIKVDDSTRAIGGQRVLRTGQQFGLSADGENSRPQDRWITHPPDWHGAVP